MAIKRRPCSTCGKNRAEKFFKSARARVCSFCLRETRRKHSLNQHLVKTYGITEREYTRLLEAQGGRCAICRRQPRYRMDVDHDHKTGVIRGILCKLCNRRLLPAVRDSVETLERAIGYLNQPPAVDALGVRTAIGP